MQPFAEITTLLALLNLGGGEIVLILALIVLLVGARKLPDASRDILGFYRILRNMIDKGSIDAGRSLGGIHGKPAAQALTHDNHVAELYNGWDKRRTSLFRLLRSCRSAIASALSKLRLWLCRVFRSIRRKRN